MRTTIAVVIFALILAVFCPPIAAQTTPPIYLFSMETKGVSTGTIHVYSVNSSTGALTEVPGSPFNAGLIPAYLVVDPTGRFVYVGNEQSADITAFSVDSATGALTELPGSPFPIGSSPQTMAIDPTGRFLYVSAATLPTGSLYEYLIDSVTGALTAAVGSPFPRLYPLSIVFNPEGNYAYLAQGSPDPGVDDPILICTVDFTSGTLTPVGSVQPAARGANVATVSPGGSFLFSIDPEDNLLDGFAIGSAGSSATEDSGSPYAVPDNPDSLVVHPTGNFLYVVNEGASYQTAESPSLYDGAISVFAIDSANGTLAPAPGSPFAAGINPTSIVVDPTGSFAYSAATTYTTGYTSFAQVMGFSINASSGVLTPFPGTPWTDSAEFSRGNQLAISYGSSTAPNPVPVISSLSPSSATAGGAAFALQVNGTNFIPGATVYFGGQLRSTTFVSSTQLDAGILSADIDNGGTAVVFVFNPLPGGGASTSVEFTVSDPVPVISSIDPSSVTAGGNALGLAVLGSNFVTSSVVNFNGLPRATRYSSPSVIAIVISAADIAAQGTADISVTSPSNGAPGGGTSNTVTFTILPPVTAFAVSSISPASAAAGGPGFTLTVNGSGFVQGAQITFNLNSVVTTFVTTTQLSAAIPASALAIVGNPYVIVTNPGGATSTPLTFIVNNPQPSGISVFPLSAPAGSNALTLKVTGTGFEQGSPGSVVLVGGSARSTIFVSSTSLQAKLLQSDLIQGGTLDITVVNPSPGGGTASAVSFIVTDYSLTPPSSAPPVTAGQTASFALMLSPSNGAFSNQVTFSISSSTPLPAGAAASFTPSPATPGSSPQTVTLSITTTPYTAASTGNLPQRSHPVPPALFVLGAIAMMAVLSQCYSERRLRRMAPQLLLALSIVAAEGLVACGAVGAGPESGAGQGPSSPTQVTPATGTPAGTYSITVLATSGAVSHSATVTLTVM